MSWLCYRYEMAQILLFLTLMKEAPMPKYLIVPLTVLIQWKVDHACEPWEMANAMAKSVISCMNHMFDFIQISNLAWIPLRCFIKSPQFEGKLKIRGFLSSFLHCSKPGAFYVKSSLHHFKLIQTCFINIFLLHYVQLWMQQTDRYTKHDEQCLTSHRSCDFTWHMSGDKSIWPMSAEHTRMELISQHVIWHFPVHTSPYNYILEKR